MAISRKDFLGAVLAGSWEAPRAAGAPRARRRWRRRRSPRRPAPSSSASTTPTRSTRCGSPRRSPTRGPEGKSARLAEILDLGGAPPLAWERLLEAGEVEERLVATSAEEPRDAELAEPPASLHPGLAVALAEAGISRLYSHQLEVLEAAAEGNVVVTSGTASGKSLSFNLPVLDRIAARPEVAGALHLPDEGARPGPGAKARPARAAGPRARDLRRRHAARGAAGDPPPGEPDPHQPRHGQHGDARSPQGLGRLPRQPRHGRRRRGAHLSRRVRLARRQRPAPPAPGRAALRLRPALHPRLGDDREPARARRAACRHRVHARRLRRRATSSAPDRDLEPAGDRRGDDEPALGARRVGRAARRPGRERLADDLLPEEPARDRADPQVHADAPRGARRAGPGAPDRALPGRLHAPAAARDRGAARPRRAARGGRDRRARARDRYRRARRGALRHLPGHGREPAPDVGAGRAAKRRHRDLLRRPGRARPVLLPPPGRVPRRGRSRRRSSTTRTSGSSSPT